MEVFFSFEKSRYYSICMAVLLASMIQACSSRPMAPQPGAYAPPMRSGSVCGEPFPLSPSMIGRLNQPYEIGGQTFYPMASAAGFSEEGVAAWYGIPFHGQATASGEIFDRNLMTAAHPALPMNTCVKVTNLANGYWLVLRINDRGPFNDARVLDTSEAAAKYLDFYQQGTTQVRIEVLP